MLGLSKTLIAIPVYNGSQYIERTVSSCLSQTVNCAIWIFDNASTDTTLQVCGQLASQNDNIKIFASSSNIGRVGNWNRVLEEFMLSEYDYIKFLFPGDEIFPDCIRQCEEVLEGNLNIGALAFPYYFIDEKGESSLSVHKTNGYVPPKEITEINLSKGMLLGAIVCNVYAKRAIGTNRFNPCHLSKAEFDIRVLENFGAYYLQVPLASFLLEAHNSFQSSMHPWAFFEFSYIEAREFYRISNTDYFSGEEKIKIENRIIYNSIRHQARFMSVSCCLRAIFFLFGSVLRRSLNFFLENIKK